MSSNNLGDEKPAVSQADVDRLLTRRLSMRVAKLGGVKNTVRKVWNRTRSGRWLSSPVSESSGGPAAAPRGGTQSSGNPLFGKSETPEQDEENIEGQSVSSTPEAEQDSESLGIAQREDQFDASEVSSPEVELECDVTNDDPDSQQSDTCSETSEPSSEVVPSQAVDDVEQRNTSTLSSAVVDASDTEDDEVQTTDNEHDSPKPEAVDNDSNTSNNESAEEMNKGATSNETQEADDEVDELKPDMVLRPAAHVPEEGDDVRFIRCIRNHALEFIKPDHDANSCDFCGQNITTATFRCTGCDIDICVDRCYPVFYHVNEWKSVLKNTPPESWYDELVVKARTAVEERIAAESAQVAAAASEAGTDGDQNTAGNENNQAHDINDDADEQPDMPAVDPRIANILPLDQILFNCLWYSMVYEPDQFVPFLDFVKDSPNGEHHDIGRVLSYLFASFCSVGSQFGDGVKEACFELLSDSRVDPTHQDNRPIRHAALHGGVDIVTKLLNDDRVDPTAQESFALRMASANGHVGVVDILLTDGRCDPAIQEMQASKMAALGGHEKVFMRLLADPRVDLSIGGDVILLWAANSLFLTSVTLILRDERVDPSAHTCIALQVAALGGRFPLVKRLMADDRMNEEGVSLAFGHACERGHMKVVKFLHEDDRCDPTFEHPRAKTSFLRACIGGQLEVIKYLLTDSRVDPAVNNSAAVTYAAAEGHADVLEFLLNDSRLSPIESLEGQATVTPLTIACSRGLIDIVKLLLADDRVDPSQPDNIPILEACQGGHSELLSILLQDIRVDPSADESSCFRIAVEKGNIEIVTKLLNDGRCNPAARDNFALRLSAANGLMACARQVGKTITLNFMHEIRIMDGLSMRLNLPVSKLNASQLEEGESKLRAAVLSDRTLLDLPSAIGSNNNYDKLSLILMECDPVRQGVEFGTSKHVGLYRVLGPLLQNQAIHGLHAMNEASLRVKHPIPASVMQVITEEYCGLEPIESGADDAEEEEQQQEQPQGFQQNIFQFLFGGMLGGGANGDGEDEDEDEDEDEGGAQEDDEEQEDDDVEEQEIDLEGNTNAAGGSDESDSVDSSDSPIPEPEYLNAPGTALLDTWEEGLPPVAEGEEEPIEE